MTPRGVKASYRWRPELTARYIVSPALWQTDTIPTSSLPPTPKNLYAHYQNYSFHGTVIHRATLCKLIPYTHSQNSTTGSVAVWPAVPFAVPFTKVVHSSVFHQLPQVAHGNGDWNTREHSNSYHPRQRRLDIGLEYRRENSYTEYVVTRNRL